MASKKKMGEKYATKDSAKSENGTSSKMENGESTSSRNEGTRDDNNSAREIQTKNYEIRCLDFIQNVAIKLKNEDDIFCNTVMKILDLDKTQESKVKALQYDLVNILLSLLLDPTEDDLKLLEATLKAMIIPVPLKRFAVDNSCIKPNCYIGQGYSSVVLAAVLSKDGLHTKVALKKPRSKLFDKWIISEATALSQLDHKNIVKMLAFEKNGPGIALELMDWGNLNQALMRNQFSDRELLKVLIDIATGMEFLHGKQYIHRDLACRNVFVSARKECKIGDFGLSVYVGDSNGEYRDVSESGVRVENFSPDSIFTFQTDVWSMGLLILELYQLEFAKMMNPILFPIMAVRIREKAGFPKPKRCPDGLFQFTMNYLLHMNYKNRPDFSAIRETLENYLIK